MLRAQKLSNRTLDVHHHIKWRIRWQKKEKPDKGHQRFQEIARKSPMRQQVSLQAADTNSNPVSPPSELPATGCGCCGGAQKEKSILKILCYTTLEI